MKTALILLALTALGCGNGFSSQDGENGISPNSDASFSLQNAFSAEAKQLLADRCTNCHGTNSGQGGVYNLQSDTHLVTTGLVVPGNPDESPLYDAIVSQRMPPGAPFTADEALLIRNWILEAGN